MKAVWQVCFFFSGSAAVAAGHLVSADPVERVGRWKNSSTVVRSMKYNTVEQLWGRGAGGQKGYLGASHTESVVYWCKVNNSCEEPSSGQGAESHEIMEKTV